MPTAIEPNDSALLQAEEDYNSDDYYSESEVSDHILHEDISSSNPADYTKSYNRARKLNDPSIPAQYKPKKNLAHGDPTAPQKSRLNTQLRVDDQLASLSKHAAKLRVDDLEMPDAPHRKGRDRAERATVEQALDPKTRMLLLQMINRNIVSEINGCISTGKEANVYHAVTISDDEEQATLHRAIKVYKTAILVFKDRNKYISGEHRFRSGYQRGSNRAMVKLWAEKEMRNLNRLYAAGIPCPEPIYLRQHVLLMQFLGDKKGYPAPRLKDFEFEGDESEQHAQWHDCYFTCLGHMRAMYQTCKLVHGDLSEYNMLFYKGKLYIIDVSQSVEHDHPRSLEFLRMDIKNVRDFFARKGVNVLSEREAFEFITNHKGAVETDAMKNRLEEIEKGRDARSDEERDRLELEDQVFREQYIPQTLDQVYDVERDTEQIQRGEGDSLIYRELLGNMGVATGAEVPEDEDHDDSEDDENESASNGDHEDWDDKQPRGHRFEDKDEKKARKEQAKAEKREARKKKMPKHLKKSIVTKTAKPKRH
ncbi:Serine/threonine-protein kinase Rio1 [Microthyrium microscopicum]|uniref:Serine/threonine-protein kinase RIO1 n=1 Tax=Microthyrium microscopicum TaxID=703497 RepID=A0A6A6UPG3_9PEZI|nr:Serine/threonine-protein kinase Rio1 [Microthyrium microscopicum]